MSQVLADVVSIIIICVYFNDGLLTHAQDLVKAGSRLEIFIAVE